MENIFFKDGKEHRRPRLIGLCGKKQSGKDTTADWLVKHYMFQKRAFADPLKECCQLLFRLTREQVHDPLQKETVDPRWGQTPRRILQRVGTDLFRKHYDESFWLRCFEEWYETHRHLDIVCTDVRFQNEADCIRRLGGVVIRITRSDIDRKEGEKEGEDLHESERQIDAIAPDFYLYNQSPSIDKFHQELDLFFHDLLLIIPKKKMD